MKDARHRLTSKILEKSVERPKPVRATVTKSANLSSIALAALFVFTSPRSTRCSTVLNVAAGCVDAGSKKADSAAAVTIV
jgi:hypothetical protein